jgi:hypothetical protein
MFIPKPIHDELDRLAASDDPLANLESLKVLEDWLADMKLYATETAQRRGHSLQEIAGVQERHPQAVHRTLKSARLEGLTHEDFRGVTSSTLRYWLDWWSDPARRPDGAEEAGRDPRVEANRVRAELQARHDAGLLRKPVGGLKA